jgi:hypothetical protein
MATGSIRSRFDDRPSKRVDDTLKRLIRLLARQAAGEACAGARHDAEDQPHAEYEASLAD